LYSKMKKHKIEDQSRAALARRAAAGSAALQ
jgi:hypothetical protein